MDVDQDEKPLAAPDLTPEKSAKLEEPVDEVVKDEACEADDVDGEVEAEEEEEEDEDEVKLAAKQAKELSEGFVEWEAVSLSL